NEIACMTPVTLGVEIPEIKFMLPSTFNRCDSTGYLACNESLTAGRTFMVEEDAVRGMYTIGFPIVYRGPISVEFCCPVWRAWVEWCCFVLRLVADAAIELGCGRLIKLGLVFHSQNANSFQESQCPQGVGIRCIFSRFK